MTTATQPEKMTADAILGIKLDDPELLFPRDAEGITGLYHRLVKLWHPDRNKKDAEAADVFAHITRLKKKAEEKIADGSWREKGFFTCRLSNGKTFKARSDARRDFDLGTLHISPTTATYVVRREYADLFRNAIQSIAALKFKDAKIKDTYFSHLPTVYKTYEAPDALILTVRKGPDEVLLRDLVPFLKDNHLDRHAAWITSRLHEMARYLDYAGLAHNAITLDTVFVSPQNHTISLFGGWWYARPVGQPMNYAPAEAIDFLPTGDGKKPPATCAKTDMEMVKAAAREILGDRGGTRLALLKPAPEPMLGYLRTPSSGDPQDDLTVWYQKILPQSFGARRFTELKVSYSDIYQPGS